MQYKFTPKEFGSASHISHGKNVKSAFEKLLAKYHKSEKNFPLSDFNVQKITYKNNRYIGSAEWIIT